MKNHESRYLTIYENLREDIVNGVYKTGEKIPSKRTCADNNRVSVITVQHAYELLADEGYITGVEKSGYFVSYSEGNTFPVGKKTNVATTVATVHNANREQNTFSYPEYTRITRKVLSSYGDEVFARSAGFGTDAIREAIANYLKRSRRIDAEKDRIIIGSGAEYLYGLIVKTLGRDMIYGIESPSYQQISRVYETEGVQIRMLPLEKDGINSDALKKTDARVLHITPYRSFPSGVTATATKKHEYLRWSAEKNAILIEDDFESEFSPSGKPEEALITLGHGDRVIYVNTFTKTIGPFIRVAYMVIPKALIKLFEQKVSFYSCPVPTVEQYVLSELLNNGDFERHINRVRRRNRTAQKMKNNM